MHPLETVNDATFQSSNWNHSTALAPHTGVTNSDEEEEEFVYPGVPQPDDNVHPPVSSSRQHPPSPAQLEALYAAASSGELPLLKKLFENALQSAHVEAFSLANDTSPRTGSTALHAAASRGYLDIVIWLIEDCGAMPDLEDREGETALHRASLNGHITVIQHLLTHNADVHARDADGWTALHNACSKGYLDIVRFLCEKGGAISIIDGVRGVDVCSRDGWTPLMNAASKGHLPVVLYLLNKQKADPLVRNKWGETAFDIAAAVFEVWICEVLQQAEAEQWQSSNEPYNPLTIHTTLPIILYENQRLDTRLKTIAVSGGRPKFSASGLGRPGRRPPFEMKLLWPQSSSNITTVATWRSDIQLPLRNSPWELPMPRKTERNSSEGIERSHFWLSDWTLDTTHPRVDADDGWQYAHHFNDPDDQWSAERPPLLERLMNSTGVIANSSRAPLTWVRRRRWVRIMRRRIDIPSLPFAKPDGFFYSLLPDGHLAPSPMPDDEPIDQELGPMSSTFLSSARDYVARARYIVGDQIAEGKTVASSLSAVETRRWIAQLEHATTELRQGILGDEDDNRRSQAEELLNEYHHDLERLRLAAGAQGLLLLDDGDLDQGDDSSDEEFHYPGALVEDRQSPTKVSVSPASTSRPSSSHIPVDLAPQLSQAPDFRVPTHETPQKVFTQRWTSPSPRQLYAMWERDESVSNCRDCQRRFGLLTRRHHCRKCGRIFCDRCSTFRAVLDPADVVHEPGHSESPNPSSSQRVCRTCYEEVTATLPTRLQGIRPMTMERIVIDQGRLTAPSPRRQSSSQLSDLAECPVCSLNLEQIGDDQAQESHVKRCLEGGSNTPLQAAKYVVYRLPADSVLLGVECVICLEEFIQESTVARLSCLCSFHNACLSSWLQRGKSCPVHAR